jgi:hypothetical protein
MQSRNAPPDRLARLVSKRDRQREISAALQLIEAGHSFSDVERRTGVSRATLEAALGAAKTRQELIRQHFQSRHGFTSLLRYPDRGPWGQGSFYGNCSGYLIVDLIDQFKPQSVFDAMEGSGTTGEVCFDLKVGYAGGDLFTGFDLLTSPLPDRLFDLIFWHPPYWPGHRYSDHPNDFSNADDYPDYLDRLQLGLVRLADRLTRQGHLVVLIGDGRKQGVFYPVHAQLIAWDILPLETILIKEGDHARRSRHYRYGPTVFIPTLHEYVVIFKARPA